MARKKTLTDQLEQPREHEVRERQAQREAEQQALAARTAAERAEQRVVQAHAGDGDLDQAQGDLDQAEREARDAALAAKGAGVRVQRAADEVSVFASTNALALIAELEPEANEVTERLTRAAHELVNASRDWQGVAHGVSDLVAAHPGGLPARDMTSQHALEGVAHDLKRALANSEVPVPLPHWTGRPQAEAEQETALAIRAQRERAAA